MTNILRAYLNLVTKSASACSKKYASTSCFFFLIVFKGCSLNIKRPWMEISRIRRQSQNFIIYFILPKRPFWWTFFKNGNKKFHRTLLSSENPIVQTTPRRSPTTLTPFAYYRLKNSNVSSRYEIKTHENPVKFFMINSHVLMVNCHINMVWKSHEISHGISHGNFSWYFSRLRRWWRLRCQISLDWYSGSAAKFHSTSTEYRQLRRLGIHVHTSSTVSPFRAAIMTLQISPLKMNNKFQGFHPI